MAQGRKTGPLAAFQNGKGKPGISVSSSAAPWNGRSGDLFSRGSTDQQARERPEPRRFRAGQYGAPHRPYRSGPAQFLRRFSDRQAQLPPARHAGIGPCRLIFGHICVIRTTDAPDPCTGQSRQCIASRRRVKTVPRGQKVIPYTILWMTSAPLYGIESIRPCFLLRARQAPKPAFAGVAKKSPWFGWPKRLDSGNRLQGSQYGSLRRSQVSRP